jgi:uncharacterized protein (DUF302 family)
MDGDGLITIASAHPVSATIDRLAAAAEAAGMRVFARIDHAAGAAEVGMRLRPTELLLFGHPRGGTPLMLDGQTAGIDLPLRALAWEDAEGRVWLTTNDARWVDGGPARARRGQRRRRRGDHGRQRACDGRGHGGLRPGLYTIGEWPVCRCRLETSSPRSLGTTATRCCMP